MQRMNGVSMLVMLALAAGYGARQGQAQEDPVKELHPGITKFLNGVSQRDNAARAFRELLRGGPLENSQSVQQLASKVERFGDQYGALLESEQVASVRIGKDLVLLKYLYKAERFPVVWYFAYYRPPKGNRDEAPWLIVSISFDTNLRRLGMKE